MTPRRRSTAPPAGGGRGVKTTVELPEAVWRAAKIRALDDRTDLRTVIIVALAAHLGVSADEVYRAR